MIGVETTAPAQPAASAGRAGALAPGLPQVSARTTVAERREPGAAGGAAQPWLRLDKRIYVVLDLDRYTLTCRAAGETICRNATRAEAAAALQRHRCAWHRRAAA